MSREIAKQLMGMPRMHPATFLACGCCAHVYLQIITVGNKQQVSRVSDIPYISRCRTHREAK